MDVDVIRSTPNPERLVCQCARGDYYEGYIGDTDYAELMKGVQFDDEYVDGGIEYDDGSEKGRHHPDVVEAKTQSFIEKEIDRGHYGIVEHPQITFSVKGVSRVTMAQITRHRHLTFDIQSMRYADFSEQEIVTPKSLTDPDHFSRETGTVDVADSVREQLADDYDTIVDYQLELYERMVENGVPKEDARFILPLGTTVNLSVSGNARSFLHLINIRSKADAQWQIRELSEMLIDELMDWMPYTFEHYDDTRPHQLSP